MKNYKIYILAILTGFVTGFITIPYRWLIEKSLAVRQLIFDSSSSKYYLVIGFVGIYLIALLINKLLEENPTITGSGIPQARGQVYGRIGVTNPVKGIFSKFIGGVLGISAGYSLGREGPSVQIGAFIGEGISKIFKTNKVDRKYLIMSGAGAGLSSAFTAPLASAVFIAEELQKYYNSRLIVCSFLGTLVSGYMASKVFIKNTYLDINISMPQDMSWMKYFGICLIFAIFMTVVGKTFSNLLMFFQKKNKELKVSKYIKILAYTSMIFVIGIFFTDLTAGGESFLIKQATEHSTGILILLFLIVLKILFTTISYSTGFPGGIFLPLLVIGGLSGKLFATILSYFNILSIDNIGAFVFLGMAAGFIVVVRSPATGIMLILEMTSDFSLLPATIVVGGFVYAISHYCNVEAIYDLLYDVIAKEDNIKNKNLNVELIYQIGEDSYLTDEEISNLSLPGNLKVSTLKRDGKEITIDNSLKLKKEDIIGVEVARVDVEKYYDSLRTLARED